MCIYINKRLNSSQAEIKVVFNHLKSMINDFNLNDIKVVIQKPYPNLHKLLQMA